MYGFWRIGIAVPTLSIAHPEKNREGIAKLWKQADADGVAVVAFPELALSGYTCADLFGQVRLLDKCRDAIIALAKESEAWQTVGLVGMPLPHKGRLFNAVLVVGQGKIFGAVAKSFLPNYKEFYEKRWFSSGLLVKDEMAKLGGYEFPFGTDLLFQCEGVLTFGVEICEDLWAPIPPSTEQCLAGADVVFNASASNDIVGKAEFRHSLVRSQSSRCISAYAYVSSGVGESSTDLVFSGDGLICENGDKLIQTERFLNGDQYHFADVDVQRLRNLRRSESTFADFPWRKFRTVNVPLRSKIKVWQRPINAHPFVPADNLARQARCQEISHIQVEGLRHRLRHTGAKAAVVGVSGGLDSALAMMVTHEAVKTLPGCELLPVTMPGFGTSSRTLGNARELINSLGGRKLEIDIKPACNQHFKDIGHDPKLHDVTFENVQARERTQVLMDLANKHGGLVVGTGDLSEMALGWSTYNGDHISMYAVNCGVPKTLVRHMVAWWAEQAPEQLKSTLLDIAATPVSPELLPASEKDEIQQLTEAKLGPYDVHDFFLYEMLRNGAAPDRMLFLAEQAFCGRYTNKQLGAWLRVFITRFFNNQFKRSCTPDGPKVGTIALSPRGDWRMPSDATYQAWLDGEAE